MVGKAKAIELTKKEVEYMKQTEDTKHHQLMQLEERVNFNTKEIHNQDPSLFFFVTDQATNLK